MNIKEQEVQLLIRANSVKRFNIVQVDTSRYAIKVALMQDGAETEATVINVRRQVSTWISLDRLTRHLQTKFGVSVPITLTMMSASELAVAAQAATAAKASAKSTAKAEKTAPPEVNSAKPKAKPTTASVKTASKKKVVSK